MTCLFILGGFVWDSGDESMMFHSFFFFFLFLDDHRHIFKNCLELFFLS